MHSAKESVVGVSREMDSVSDIESSAESDARVFLFSTAVGVPL